MTGPDWDSYVSEAVPSPPSTVKDPGGHTPAPWTAIGPACVGIIAVPAGSTSSGISVVPCLLHNDCPADMDHEQYERDCRRAAAAVNACAGVPTDLLEKLPLGALADMVEAARIRREE